jgi:hypothetical protein
MPCPVKGKIGVVGEDLPNLEDLANLFLNNADSLRVAYLRHANIL